MLNEIEFLFLETGEKLEIELLQAKLLIHINKIKCKVSIIVNSQSLLIIVQYLKSELIIDFAEITFTLKN